MLCRCTNCNRTFEAPRPLCEVCAIDPLKDRRFAGIVVKVAKVHFDPPHPTVRGHGVGFTACSPAKPVQGQHASGEAHVVNCAACRATDAWKKAAAADPEFMAEQDEFVDPAQIAAAPGCCGA